MILKNFKIQESYGIEYEGEFLDLHSNYDFVKYSYNVSCQSAELEWVKNAGEWATKEQFKKLILKFNSVSFFAVKARDEQQPYSEDKCLSHIGYLHPDDTEIMNGFLPEKMARDGYHLVLGFESDLFIKLLCADAELFTISV